MANSFKLSTASSVGTAEVSVYECPSATSTTIIGMTIANIINSQIAVNVKINDGGASKIHLVKNAPIPAGGSLVVVGGDQKVVLEPTDVIIVQSDTTASGDVTVSYLEIS
ncbi:hypothetical protein N8704_01355 [bacterium]|nr:hypothetical protein [bacterium]